MIVRGYKLKGYDATYEKCDLDIRIGVNCSENRVLEVLDMQSGVTYIFECGDIIRDHKSRGTKKSSCKM